MPIPDDIRTDAEKQLDRYCLEKIPEHAYGKVRLCYIVKDMAITLFEQQPHFRDIDKWMQANIARMRYSKTFHTWTLYWRDRNNKWHLYDQIPPAADFGRILQELDTDPTGIFWG